MRLKLDGGENPATRISSARALGHPLAKHFIHARLPTCACAFEIRHHFGVIAQGDWRLGGPMLGATLTLAFLNQGVAYRAITTAGQNKNEGLKRDG